MSVLDKLNVGLVGAVGRGGAYAAAFEANSARIHAVCDIQVDKLEECRYKLGANEKYTEYAEMLNSSELDAVVIGTPMPLHVPQAIMALERNLHVLSEVPAGVSIQECQSLVKACSESKTVYMMAENYIYTKPNTVVRALVQQGLFGQVYYAEGEYLHELKERDEMTPWRRRWQKGIAGVTYGTHSLGPILQWMPGDRVVRVCCADSAVHYQDRRGEYYAQQTPVMLCKTQQDALIKIRVDMISDRPHAMSNYQLQGTDGVYESARGGAGEGGKIWLRKLSQEFRWHDLGSLMNTDVFAERYVPEIWRNPPDEAMGAGHGGGDYFVVQQFIGAIRGDGPCPSGIHEAMDITLPGLISQQSILQDGAWLEVPDSRTWTGAAPVEQLQMIWPERLLDSPPVAKVHQDYLLRCYTDADQGEYLEVMAKAGFEDWNPRRLTGALSKVLPEGLFVIVHRATGQIVATAMASHNPHELHPYGGELAWVAAHPEHRTLGLGLAVCAAVTARLLRAGYRRIYLLTDDFRLPAIKTYLKLGYEPFILAEDMAERWDEVYEKVGSHQPG